MPFTDQDPLNDELTEQQFYRRSKPISWEKIVKDGGFKDLATLNKAIKTSNGSLNDVFSRPDLEEKLFDLTSEKELYEPTEGTFDVFSKVAIYKAFKLLGKNKIILMDEFYEGTSILELNHISELDFAEKITMETYYIFSEEKEILFTIEWESCFFLIAARKAHMDLLISSKLFEGFLCTNETTHHWDYSPGEFEQLVKKEQILTKMKPLNSGISIFYALTVLFSGVYWMYYKIFSGNYITEAHGHFRQFIFDYGIREILVICFAGGILYSLIYFFYSGSKRMLYITIPALILLIWIFSEIHISKGP
jgi:hypothetical protein